MTITPAGWYRDPWFPQYPGALRYWDGAQWTGWTNQVPIPNTPAPRRERESTTPDGQPLASWARRLGAHAIDWALQWSLFAAIAVPFTLTRLDDIREGLDVLDAWGRADVVEPLPWDALAPMLILYPQLVAASVVLGAVYTIGFWRWKQATPGKLILGLRIRRRESPDLPWSAILARYAAIFGFGLIGIVVWIDYLWPLWDDRLQTLHDKVAGTHVVIAPGSQRRL